ncbi:unnamed protein product [Allacma fusca]|uniref:Uncharacterized protein n=1 Tax=Allacma fusca TaxID=39272 RepID=A0A8J2PAI4_9HEXA|nr:unnamed protein product [Allacma fusca]
MPERSTYWVHYTHLNRRHWKSVPPNWEISKAPVDIRTSSSILYVDGIKAKLSDVAKQALRQTSFYQRLDQRATTKPGPDPSTSESLFDPPAKRVPASVKSTRWDLPLLQIPLQYFPAKIFPEAMLRKSPTIIPTDGSTGRDLRSFKRSPSAKRTLAPIVSPVRNRASPQPTLKKPGVILKFFGYSDDEGELEDPGKDC